MKKKPEQFVSPYAPEGGIRANEGKPRFSLISPYAAEGLAKVLTYGAAKYEPHNWKKGLSFEETIDSLMRHLTAIQRGELIDPETGLMHIDHVQCNAMFLSHFMHNPAQYEKFNDI